MRMLTYVYVASFFLAQGCVCYMGTGHFKDDKHIDLRLHVEESDTHLMFNVVNMTDVVFLLRNAHNVFPYLVEYDTDGEDFCLLDGGVVTTDWHSAITVLPSAGVDGHPEPVTIISIEKPKYMKSIYSASLVLHVISLEAFQSCRFQDERSMWDAFRRGEIRLYAENLPFRQRVVGDLL